MIYQHPTPITKTIQTLQQLIDASIAQPDVRMLMKTMLDSIDSATRFLWSGPNLEQADHKRLMADALQFYAEGGEDHGKRAQAVFAMFERDRAHYSISYRPSARMVRIDG